jgi:tetratricopeptide (TPR) repeat protein
MKICAVVCSNNSESIIRDCLESVIGWVDEVLIVDSGITDKTLEIAREVCGEKLRTVFRSTETFVADPEDFGSQRNFGLDEAAKTADWAVIVDTDERIHWKEGFDLRAFLEKTDKPFLTLKGVKEKYAYHKSKFFRLPTKFHYHGGIHEEEWFDGNPAPVEASPLGGYFTELKKTANPERRQFEARRLEEECAKEPNNARWPYFLGQTYRELGRIDEAIEQYNRCYDLKGSCEERALAMFYASQCAFQVERYEQARDLALKGTMAHPGVAENFWMAAVSEHLMGHHETAALWAHHAACVGIPHGVGKLVARTSTLVAPANFSGPFDIMRRSFQALGATALANQMQVMWVAALAAENDYLTG